MYGDGVTRVGTLDLQLGSRGVTRGRSGSMLATSPAAAALTAHHHPAQGSQPGGGKNKTKHRDSGNTWLIKNNEAIVHQCRGEGGCSVCSTNWQFDLISDFKPDV